MQKTLPPIPEKSRGILRQMAEPLLDRYRPRLERLTLFGFYAQGEAQPKSDVDRLEIPL